MLKTFQIFETFHQTRAGNTWTFTVDLMPLLTHITTNHFLMLLKPENRHKNEPYTGSSLDGAMTYFASLHLRERVNEQLAEISETL